jgi:hypothetical protein
MTAVNKESIEPVVSKVKLKSSLSQAPVKWNHSHFEVLVYIFIFNKFTFIISSLFRYLIFWCPHNHIIICHGNNSLHVPTLFSSNTQWKIRVCCFPPLNSLGKILFGCISKIWTNTNKFKSN